MAKQALSKQIFGIPSLETARAIDDSDAIAAHNAASFRMQTRLRELDSMYEVKAREIRAAFLQEIAGISGEADEA
jgi:hypothetical protein